MYFFMQFTLFGKGCFKSCFITVHYDKNGFLCIGLLKNTSSRKESKGVKKTLEDSFSSKKRRWKIVFWLIKRRWKIYLFNFVAIKRRLYGRTRR